MSKQLLGVLPTYRGAFAEGTEYYCNNTVTHGETVWVCRADATTETPSEGSEAWSVYMQSKSAYDYAVQHGYTGTEAQYYAEMAKVGEAVAMASLLSDVAVGKAEVVEAVRGCGVEVADGESLHGVAEAIGGNLAKLEEMGYFKKLGYGEEDMGFYRDQLALAEDLRQTWESVKSNQWLSSYDKKRITIIPKVDTSVLTSMSGMFDGCTSLQSVPRLDTTNATNATMMFRKCSSLQSVPALNMPCVQNTEYMFSGCTSLQSASVTNTTAAKYMGMMFDGCTSLQTIPLLDMGNVTSANNMFTNCTSLTLCHLTNLKISLSFSSSPLLAPESVAYIVSHAANTSAITITLHAAVYANAIADEEVQAALAEHPLVSLASA